MRYLWILTLVACARPAPPVTGIVLTADGKPAKAFLRASGGAFSAVTDSSGKFTLRGLPAGSHWLCSSGFADPAIGEDQRKITQTSEPLPRFVITLHQPPPEPYVVQTCADPPLEVIRPRSDTGAPELSGALRDSVLLAFLDTQPWRGSKIVLRPPYQMSPEAYQVALGNHLLVGQCDSTEVLACPEDRETTYLALGRPRLVAADTVVVELQYELLTPSACRANKHAARSDGGAAYALVRRDGHWFLGGAARLGYGGFYLVRDSHCGPPFS
jgi:hypothetical protein